MGCAEVISFAEVRARHQWTTLRQRLHAHCDQWLDAREQRLNAPQPTWTEVTQAVWDLRQSLTGRVTEAIIMYASQNVSHAPYACCPQCARRVTSRGAVRRGVETLVGPVQGHRASLYCGPCSQGFYPLDATLALAPGHTQFAVQQAAAKLVAEVPYETAHVLFTELTGVALGTERMHAARLPLAFSRALSHERRMFLDGCLATLTVRLEDDLSIVSICCEHGDNVVGQLGVSEQELDGTFRALLLRFGIRSFRVSTESVKKLIQYGISPWRYYEG